MDPTGRTLLGFLPCLEYQLPSNQTQVSAIQAALAKRLTNTLLHVKLLQNTPMLSQAHSPHISVDLYLCLKAIVIKLKAQVSLLQVTSAPQAQIVMGSAQMALPVLEH